MTSEIVLVCSPVPQFVGEVSPNDAILIEWQQEHAQLVVEMLDGLVGDNHAKHEEEDERKACAACQNPVFREDGVG